MPTISSIPAACAAADISVIMPVYNGARFLARAIGSVLAQTLPPCELIVIDDGSTDASVALVTEHMGTQLPFPLQLHRQPNGGQAAARNHGARHARGEFLAFLDQDDVWYPRHLEALSAPLLAEPLLGWSYSDVDVIDASGGLVTQNFLSTMPATHPKRSLNQLLSEDMFILPSASLVRKAAFQRINGFDERLRGYEDDDLFLRLFRDGWHNTFLHEALAQYRSHAESAYYLPIMARSRDLYAQKLLQMFPDEPEMSRYYCRDIIAPRFYHNAVGQYRHAMLLADWQSCRQSLSRMRRYQQLLALSAPRRVGVATAHALMRHPALFREVYRVYGWTGVWRLLWH